MKRLLKKAVELNEVVSLDDIGLGEWNKIDFANRLEAFAFIEGQIYTGDIHPIIVEEYLRKNENLDDDSVLDAGNQAMMREEIEEIQKVAFGHYLKIDNQDSAVLETYSLQNVTEEEVISAIQQHYPGAQVFLTDQPIENRDYGLKRIAKKRLKY